MSVTAQTPFNSFTAAPGATVFSTEFRVILASDLVVKVAGATVTSGFTVAGLGEAGGVDVTFSTPMTGGELVELLRDVPLTRATDYQQLGDFLSPVVNQDLDRLWMALQGQSYRLGGVLRVPNTEQVPELPPASARAGRVLAFDSLGRPTTAIPTSGDVGDLALDLASPAPGNGAAMVSLESGDTLQEFAEAVQAFEATRPTLASGTPATVVAAHPLGKIRVPVGETLANGLQLNGQCLDGSGLGAVLKAAPAAPTVLRLGYVNTPGQWARKSIRDLVIDGNAKASDGATYDAAANDEIAGRWSFDGFVIKDCAKGVHKPFGNIGNSYRNGAFAGNDFGVYAVGQASPAMHAGCDTYEDVDFSGHALAACYYDGNSINGSGGLMFGRNVTIQYNPGFGVYVKDWATSYTPVVFDGTWFEGNATSPSVTIDGTAYTPKNIRLERVAQAVMCNSIVPSVELVASKLSIDNCVLISDFTSIEADAESVVTATNIAVDGGVHALEIQSITRSSRESGNFAGAWWAPARNVFISDSTGKVVSQPFTSIVTFGGTHSVPTTVVSDGRIYSTCGELTVPASAAIQAVAATLTAGKWAVLTVDIKHVSGLLSQLSIGQVQAQNLIGNYAPLLRTGKWKTIACVAQLGVSGATVMNITNGAAGAQVLRLSAMQVLQFDTEQEAVNFINAWGFVL